MQPQQAAIMPVTPIDIAGDTHWEKVKAITQKLEEGIAALFESDKYKEYLRVMARFHRYSLGNTLLIFFQKPDASLVAGFHDWQRKFKRNVKKGEKGIRILAPIMYKRKNKDRSEDQDGDEEEDTATAFRVVSVFDVSQTEGAELPSIGVDELTGDVDQYRALFDALKAVSPAPIAFEQIDSGAHGYYHLEERRIAIQQSMSQLQILKTGIHEVAHAMLHALDESGKRPADDPDRRTREVEAESVAYTVCQHFGLDTASYSFGYVAGWSSGKELKELKASLDIIRRTSHDMIIAIEKHLGMEVAA